MHSISFHLISCHLISSHVISSHLMSSHLISSKFISFNFFSSHRSSLRINSFHLISSECSKCGIITILSFLIKVGLKFPLRRGRGGSWGVRGALGGSTRIAVVILSSLRHLIIGSCGQYVELSPLSFLLITSSSPRSAQNVELRHFLFSSSSHHILEVLKV